MNTEQIKGAALMMERLESFVGRGSELPGKPSRVAVNAGFIQQLTDIVGDRNPVYSDPAFAEQSVHGQIVAPPTALSMWRLRGLDPAPGSTWAEDGVTHFRQDPNGVRIRSEDARTIRDELNDVFAEYGYSSPVVTNETFVYHRYLHLGDRITIASPVIKSIVGPKQTRLGEGFFVTLEQAIIDAAGEPVATVEQRYLRFKPAAAAGGLKEGGLEDGAAIAPREVPPIPVPPSDRVPAPGPREATLAFDDVAVGDEVTPLVVELTASLIIGGALATQDFQDVHHDRDIARRRGHPDVFMNIVTSCALVGRFITDWAGPEALIRRFEVRLGRPNYPNDTMTLTGEVRSVQPAGTGGLVTVDVRGANSIGDHTTCVVTVELSGRGDAA